MGRLDEVLAAWTWTSVTGTGVLLLVLLLLALAIRQKGAKTKWVLFLLMMIPALATTAFLSVSTMLVNAASESGGPVHWHAAIQVYACGRELNLIDPTGLTNRIGTPLLHEHNDKQMHVEGVVLQRSDISLVNFFDVISGYWNSRALFVPTNNGPVHLENGDLCSDGSVAELQAFVYHAENGVARQYKLTDPASYILKPQTKVPPGDCIIVEFGPAKEKTEHVCDLYQFALQRGELSLE